jgi:hypothetical protein
MRIATFNKLDNGNVLLSLSTPEGQFYYSLRPDRDIIPSSDNQKVIIDFYENSDRNLSLLPSEIDGGASTPDFENPTNTLEAIFALQQNFFFEVSGGSQSGPVSVFDHTVIGGEESGFSNILLSGIAPNPLVQLESGMLKVDEFSVDPEAGTIAFNPPLSEGDQLRILVILQQ